MKGYELIQKMVDELAHGSPFEFQATAGLSDSYVAVNKLRESAHIHSITLKRIETAYAIRVLVRGGEYLGWEPRVKVAVGLEQKALKLKAEFRAIVEEAESKIDALLEELKEL